MAVLEQVIHLDAEDDDEFAWETEDSENDSDDSEEDPTFDLVEKTKGLSINGERSGRSVSDSDSDDGEETEKEHASTRADSRDSEQVEEIIHLEQVEKLKVDQLKAYLRRHTLRLTGKKDVLIQRVKEHLEIVNGRGEEKYPPSSFVLNCKGDACNGDVVMFEQVVYKKRPKAASTSSVAPPCKKRTVAGRIIKESYGSAKQQHTFTIEVLWSKGDKPLPPLHPLLIIGRNLYKLNTMRQRWEDEGERLKALNEKHSRGSVARSNREARIQRKEALKNLRDNNRNRHKQGQLPPTQMRDKQHFRPNMIMNQSNAQLRPQLPINKENTYPLPPSQGINSKVPSFHHHQYCPLPPSMSAHPHSKAPESFHDRRPQFQSFHNQRRNATSPHSKAPESFHDHRPPFQSFHDQRRNAASFNGRYQAPAPVHHRYHAGPALRPYLHSTTQNYNHQTGHGYGDVNAQRVYHHGSGYYDHPERQPQGHNGHYHPSR